MSGELPSFCPYCRHTTIHVRVAAWAYVQNGEIQLIDFDNTVGVLDEQPNAVCDSCHGEFQWKRPI